LTDVVSKTGLGHAAVDVAKILAPDLADRIDMGVDLAEALMGGNRNAKNKQRAAYRAAPWEQITTPLSVAEWIQPEVANLIVHYARSMPQSLMTSALARLGDDLEFVGPVVERFASPWELAAVDALVVDYLSGLDPPAGAAAAVGAPARPSDMFVRGLAKVEYPVVAGESPTRWAGDRDVVVCAGPVDGVSYYDYSDRVHVDATFQLDRESKSARSFARCLELLLLHMPVYGPPKTSEVYVTTNTSSVDGDSWQLAALLAMVGATPSVIECIAPLEAAGREVAFTGALGPPHVKNHKITIPILPVGDVDKKSSRDLYVIAPAANRAGGVTSVRLSLEMPRGGTAGAAKVVTSDLTHISLMYAPSGSDTYRRQTAPMPHDPSVTELRLSREVAENFNRRDGLILP
jgi:hypothetical protein